MVALPECIATDFALERPQIRVDNVLVLLEVVHERKLFGALGALEGLWICSRNGVVLDSRGRGGRRNEDD